MSDISGHASEYPNLGLHSWPNPPSSRNPPSHPLPHYPISSIPLHLLRQQALMMMMMMMHLDLKFLFPVIPCLLTCRCCCFFPSQSLPGRFGLLTTAVHRGR